LLASRPPEIQAAVLAKLTDAEADALCYDWRQLARAEQIAPGGDWGVWLFLAGRGAGKTRAGAEWVREQVKAGCQRISLIAPTAGDARDVMVEGESGLLSVCWTGDKDHRGNIIGRPIYEPSKRRVTWDNGAVATLFSAEEPERLRGPQSDALWADELAAWQRAQDTWDMAMFGLRLGSNPRAMVTTTPKPLPLVRAILNDARTAVTKGNTFDNAKHLAPQFLAAMRDKYHGTRLGRQELYAEILDDVVGALWTMDSIVKRPMAEMQRIVVGVDPSGGGDDIGIIVAGRGVDGLFYVIEDATCNMSPAGWAKRVVDRYHHHAADLIVAERNFGGDMVESTIRTADKNVPIKMVTASRGKSVRAEPIAALYEQQRVIHSRGLDALESQMMQFTLSGFVGDGSPDRVDALVWALSELQGGSDYTWEGAI